MRKRSPANNAASSPPVPARISRNKLASSRGSFGISNRPSSFSSSAMRASASGISSLASSRISGSSRIASAESRSRCACSCSASDFTTGSSCENSRDRSRKRLLSESTEGSASRRPTSSWRSARASSLRRRLGVIVTVEKAFGDTQKIGVAAERSLAQCAAGRMQQAIGELVREAFEHLVRILAALQLFAGLAERAFALVFAAAAQQAQRVLPALRLPPGHVVLDLQADDRFRLLRGFATRSA